MPDDFIPMLQNALIIGAVACAVFGLVALFETQSRMRRLNPASAAMTGGPSLRRGGSPLERFLTFQFTRRFIPSDVRERTSLKLWLAQAGYDSSRAVETYYAVRVALGMVLPIVTMLAVPILAPELASGAFSVGLLAAVFGFMFPAFWISRRRKWRQQQIRDGLPDILDLLLVCTEAGLGLDMAIAKVGEEAAESQPLLAENLRMITTEVRAGRSRPDAMRGFADRAAVSEATSLVNLLVQSDALGTSMASALRIFAEDMRAHRLLKAEEMAQKVTVKLSLVLVGCFMPALITAIMAPVIFNIVRTWKGMPPL